MMEPFLGSNIKIERAKHHLQHLAKEIAAYFACGSAKIILERDHEMEISGVEMCCFRYRILEPIPLEWSAVIGDVIHNLRTSLDLLACDVHRITGGNEKERSAVYFPFCKDKADLTEMIKRRRLSGIGREFIDAIHSIAPYKNGNAGLRALHDLDILDKHQALVPTFSAAKMPWPGLPPEGGPPEFGTGLAVNGQRIIMMPKALCNLPYGTVLNAEFLIVFDAGLFRGAAVIDQLQACFEGIQAIVKLFEDIAQKGGII